MCQDRVFRMKTRSSPPPLAERSVAPFNTPRLWLALAVAVLAALVLLVVATANGHVGDANRSGLWRLGLQPAVIFFILGVWPLLQQRWWRALESVQLLRAHAGMTTSLPEGHRRGEWLAAGAGTLFSLLISGSLPSTDPWQAAYEYAANIVMFTMMALSIYDGVARTRQLARLVGPDLHLDLFDRASLVPLARWGQSITLTFVGGTCLSLMFQSYRSLHTIASLVIYATVVLVALTLFFTSTWSIHVALRAARERELADVQQRLQAARRQLKKHLAQQVDLDPAAAYQPVVMLGFYERQVLDASTWPFDPKIVKELVASVAAPVFIYGLKLAIGLPGAA